MIKVDLNWDDREVLPDKIRPDVAFLLQRMNLATLEMVAAVDGELIMDVGCGRAIDALGMSAFGARVIGIEPSRVMTAHAVDMIKLDGHRISLVRGIGELVPVAAGSVDKVICKGALDHFADPEKAVQQMAAAVKPNGQVIIAVANFSSLGFKIGEFIFWLRKVLGIKNPYKRLPWQLPPDHTLRFDYRMVTRMAGKYLKLEKVEGVSLLCAAPGWGDFLGKLPVKTQDSVLHALDRFASRFPALSDVVILRGRSCRS
ncbi:MAG: class I SAM-dependent methyltransferase [Dehalococcoidia bacterium]|nr:class I SAM-dependent methyltransferase [Dehalococcoidia bacterium]MDD5494591.1 class I SAM-dependent methyltransferase [Dehalococcoidia bacterium]